jgi:hypothetical protein
VRRRNVTRTTQNGKRESNSHSPSSNSDKVGDRHCRCCLYIPYPEGWLKAILRDEERGCWRWQEEGHRERFDGIFADAVMRFWCPELDLGSCGSDTAISFFNGVASTRGELFSIASGGRVALVPDGSFVPCGLVSEGLISSAVWLLRYT